MAEIINIPRTVEAGGETFNITQLGFGEAKRACAYLREVIGDLQNCGHADINILDILMAGGDGVSKVLAMVTDKPISWIDALPYSDVFVLASTVFELNYEVFTKNVAPAASPLMAKLLARVTPVKA